MKMEEMYTAMNIEDTIINKVNSHINVTKFISWNEMHQKPAKELVDNALEAIGDEDAITMIDWCFDINTLNAISAIFKYAQENNIGIIISYAYSLVIICKSKDIEKEILKKLPQSIIETSQYNMTNLEVYDESCVITYNNKQVQLKFATRPDYIYKLITNTYE
jgi:hypothetical protein